MPRHSLSLWIRAVRAYSFTASITPVLLGSALAWYQTGSLDGPLMLAAVTAGLALHTGTNLFNDYFDYRNGVDRPGALGGSGVLVAGLLRPRDVVLAGLVAFGLAAGLGLWLAVLRGWPIVALGLAGLAGGYFYTAGPIAYKYRALGEPLVFALMGPLMVWGGHFVQVGRLELAPLVVSLPVGVLVAAILFANNFRDLADDTASGYHTEASLLGPRAAAWAFAAMLAAAYLMLIGLVAAGEAPWPSLLALASVPLAVRVAATILAAARDRNRRLVGVVERTAQLHLLFGLLFTAGFMLAGWAA